MGPEQLLPVVSPLPPRALDRRHLFLLSLTLRRSRGFRTLAGFGAYATSAVCCPYANGDVTLPVLGLAPIPSLGDHRTGAMLSPPLAALVGGGYTDWGSASPVASRSGDCFSTVPTLGPSLSPPSVPFMALPLVR